MIILFKYNWLIVIWIIIWIKIDIITTINDIVETIESAFSSSPEKPKEIKKSVTLEEVRAVLAEKSRAGKTAEVKGLLTKFGVNKLSELDASKYDELLKETEGI